MYKRIFALIVICQIAIAVWADNAILIEQKNGQKTRLVFSSEAEMTYSGGNLVITSGEGQTTFELSTLKKATFQMDATSVEDVKNMQTTFYFKDNTITVSNAKTGAMMRIFSVDGRCLGSWRTDSQGRLQVSLNSFKERIYIVSLDGITYKIAKS